MFNEITLSTEQLDFLIEQAVKRTLEETGLVSKFISRQETIARIGRGAYDRGVKEGLLNEIKNGGKTSKIRLLRTEVEKYEYKNLILD